MNELFPVKTHLANGYRVSGDRSGVWRGGPSHGPVDHFTRVYVELSDPEGGREIPQRYARFGYVAKRWFGWSWFANHPDTYRCSQGRAVSQKTAQAMVEHARRHPGDYEWV